MTNKAIEHLAGRRILGHDWPLFVLALVLLGASMGIDVMVHSEAAWRIVLEDGAKLCGITAWATFFARVAWRTLGNPRPQNSTLGLRPCEPALRLDIWRCARAQGRGPCGGPRLA